MESAFDQTASGCSSFSALTDTPGSTCPTTPGSDSDAVFFPVANNNNDYTLVIGGLGYIGSHTAVELLKAGENVIIVDDCSNSFATVLAQIATAASIWCKSNDRTLPELQFHQMDYRSKAMRSMLEAYSDLVLEAPEEGGEPTLCRRSKIVGVIHFAAFKSVGDSISNPISYYRNNVSGLIDLVELLGSHNIKKFVFSSSATVYGTKADLGLPLKEEDVVHHPYTYLDNGKEVTVMPGVTGLLSPYARTKYFGEAILADLAYSDPSWNIIALRYFNPIGCDASGLLGEDPRGVPTNLFPVITQVLTGDREHLNIFGSDWDTRDGTAVRDFIHVSDLARGHIAAVDATVDAPFRTFNLGTGTGTTVAEALYALEAASGQRIPSRLTGRREGDVGSCVASNARATIELGWTTTETVVQAARDVWNFVSHFQRVAA